MVRDTSKNAFGIGTFLWAYIRTPFLHTGSRTKRNSLYTSNSRSLLNPTHTTVRNP